MAYVEAVEVDGDVDYAQHVKIYGPAPDGFKGRYNPAECIGAKKETVKGSPKKAHISTPYVERQNLTMRMSMRRAVPQCPLPSARRPFPQLHKHRPAPQARHALVPIAVCDGGQHVRHTGILAEPLDHRGASITAGALAAIATDRYGFGRIVVQT